MVVEGLFMVCLGFVYGLFMVVYGFLLFCLWFCLEFSMERSGGCWNCVFIVSSVRWCFVSFRFGFRFRFCSVGALSPRHGSTSMERSGGC